MSDPQFIPNSRPHSVEMPDGSHVAKSKSGKAGTEVRRVEQDHFAQDQEIAVEDHHVVLTRSAADAENRIKVPRSENIERASKALQPASGAAVPKKRAASAGRNAAGNAAAKPVYDVEMADMNFPARLIQLKVENDAVRVQLESLQSLMQKPT
jgi:hypothetical protein